MKSVNLKVEHDVCPKNEEVIHYIKSTTKDALPPPPPPPLSSQQ